MRITSNGITQINGALVWAEFVTGKSYTLADVEISEHKGARNPFAISLEADCDLVAEGATFDEAAANFYKVCHTASEPAS